MSMRSSGQLELRRVCAIALVALVVVSGACSSDDDVASDDSAKTSTRQEAPAADATQEPLPYAVQELSIDAKEYTFEISPDPSGGLQAGWTLIRFHNLGDEPHQVMFARIKDGVDMSELAVAGAGDSSGAAAIEFVDMIGGVSYIGAGHDTTALVNLTEGTVMAMCYVPNADGVAHALMGMSTALTVSASSEGPADGSSEPSSPDDAASEPASDAEPVLGTIELSEDGYRFPTTMESGWYHVKNTDSVLHELSLMHLGDPVDDTEAAQLVSDLAANRTPTVELDAVGGMGAISAGFDGYLHLDLADGEYLAVDFMPDPGVARPHMLDGYYDTFLLQPGD